MTTTAETVAVVAATVPSITFGFDLKVTMATIVTVVIAILGWSHTRWRAIQERIDATHARIDASNERLDRHETRIGKVEQDMNHLPAKADVHALQMVVERMSGDLREIRTGLNAAAERTQRQENVVQRVEEYLLKERAR